MSSFSLLLLVVILLFLAPHLSLGFRSPSPNLLSSIQNHDKEYRRERGEGENEREGGKERMRGRGRHSPWTKGRSRWKWDKRP